MSAGYQRCHRLKRAAGDLQSASHKRRKPEAARRKRKIHRGHQQPGANAAPTRLCGKARERPPQHPSRAPHVAGGHQRANRRSSKLPAHARARPVNVHGETELRAKCRQLLIPAGAASAQSGNFALHARCARPAPTRIRCTNSSRRQGARAMRRKASTSTASTPVALSRRRRSASGVSSLGALRRPQQLLRVRIECDRHGARTSRACFIRCPARISPVAQMHAVKVANRRHCRAKPHGISASERKTAAGADTARSPAHSVTGTLNPS